MSAGPNPPFLFVVNIQVMDGDDKTCTDGTTDGIGKLGVVDGRGVSGGIDVYAKLAHVAR